MRDYKHLIKNVTQRQRNEARLADARKSMGAKWLLHPFNHIQRKDLAK